MFKPGGSTSLVDEPSGFSLVSQWVGHLLHTHVIPTDKGASGQPLDEPVMPTPDSHTSMSDNSNEVILGWPAICPSMLAAQAGHVQVQGVLNRLLAFEFSTLCIRNRGQHWEVCLADCAAAGGKNDGMLQSPVTCMAASAKSF